MKISEIQVFDKSTNVNSFDLLGKSMWLDKSTRVGLFNSISIEKMLVNQIPCCGMML